MIILKSPLENTKIPFKKLKNAPTVFHPIKCYNMPLENTNMLLKITKSQ